MRKKGHTMIDCICPFCGIAFQRTLSDYNTTLKKGGKHYCSKRCNGLAVKAKRQAESGMNEERFWNLVDKTPGQGPNGDCWEWQGRRSEDTYGVVSWKERSNKKGHIVFCHRLAYEIVVGTIPEGLYLMHSCDNPPCCNPAHLSPGTKGDNNRDAKAKGRNSHGSKHPSTKLTEEQVEEILLMQLIGFTHVDISKKYPISVDASYGIKSGRNWKHVLVDKSHEAYPRLLDEFETQYRLKRTKNGHSQLMASDVLEIREKLQQGHTYHDLAGEYNIAYETVIQIKNRVIWKEI